MSAAHCCAMPRKTKMRTPGNGPYIAPSSQRASRLRRARRFSVLVIPGTFFVLLPKCPMCLVAYVALATGIGISLTTATYLKLAVASLCVTWVAYVALKRVLLGVPRSHTSLGVPGSRPSFGR
jgi:hypothetical protein